MITPEEGQARLDSMVRRDLTPEQTEEAKRLIANFQNQLGLTDWKDPLHEPYARMDFRVSPPRAEWNRERMIDDLRRAGKWHG